MYKSEVKEMSYNTKKQSILYLEVNDDDTAIVIIDRGGWPCSYIKMPDDIYQNYVESIHWDGDYDDIDVCVHGGVTFGSSEGLCIDGEKDEKIPEGYYLGWDYAHCNDYIYRGDFSVLFHESGKRYTIAELMDEAHEALEELRENGFKLCLLED